MFSTDASSYKICFTNCDNQKNNNFARILVDEGTTPRVLTFGLPDMAQEQDGHSKPKKPKTN
jgi:hypothetical protein